MLDHNYACCKVGVAKKLIVGALPFSDAVSAPEYGVCHEKQLAEIRQNESVLFYL
jgi:hypothetical protein